MPRLMIRIGHQKAQVYTLHEGETVLGRGESCRVQLQNVSVSREHARILVGKQNVSIEDLDSQNGILVNGKVARQQPLTSGDEITIGLFTIIYLGDSGKNRFYKGRCVDYMPKYEPSSMNEELQQEATFMMTASMLAKSQRVSHLVESARIVREEDTTKFWYPEDQGLTFGGAGQVNVAGWLSFGIVAVLSWDGNQHVIRTTASWRAPLSINKKVVQKRPLRHGDRVAIGGSKFRYDAPGGGAKG